jgi:hypothetical protein
MYYVRCIYLFNGEGGKRTKGLDKARGLTPREIHVSFFAKKDRLLHGDGCICPDMEAP